MLCSRLSPSASGLTCAVKAAIFFIHLYRFRCSVPTTYSESCRSIKGGNGTTNSTDGSPSLRVEGPDPGWRHRQPSCTAYGVNKHLLGAFRVITLDATGHPTAIEEKPANPKSRIAVTGLYMYTADVLEVTAQVCPSARAELEITDVNRLYLEQGRLRVHNLGRGVAWLDGGTPEDLWEASQFVKVIQDRTGMRVACPEEIAYRRGFIDRTVLGRLVQCAPVSDYRAYLLRVLEDPLMRLH
jgi:hypothetical protein